MNIIPNEIQMKIFMYLQNPEAKLITNIINDYTIDHNYYYSKHSGFYYVKNFMSFSMYYFDVKENPDDYELFQRRFV